MPTQECKPLLDTCGMNIFSRNPFRLLAVDVDQKARKITRKEKELQAAIRVNDLADEYTDVLRPDPLPTGEELSLAGRELTDAQQRFIHEFFWFRPLEWGKSSSDEILNLLKTSKGKAKEAQKRWVQIAAEGGEASLAAKHNLAVLGHWQAVAQEQKILAGANNAEPTREERKEFNRYWNFAFKYWEPIYRDEAFWSMQADRIRALDDPRLTTGFLRRFSQSLPIAFDNINADLAVAFCDRHMYARARDHVRIMKATNAGDDDVDVSLRRVTEPLQARIDQAIETATSQLLHNKTEGKKRCVELFNTVRSILNVLQVLLGQELPEYIETCDRVAESMLGCQIMYCNETNDWKGSVSLLELALKVARSEDTTGKVGKNLDIIRTNIKLGGCWFCQDRQSSDECAVKCPMHGNVQKVATGYNSHRLTWQHAEINVPRCTECKEHHERIAKVSQNYAVIGALAGAPSLLIILTMGWGGLCVAIAVAGIAAAIGAAIGGSAASSQTPYKIKRERDVQEFDRIKELRGQGWISGKKPAEA